MKWLAAQYYSDFQCIANKCRHNCCVGWDVAVDDDTAALYRTVSGDFGKRLANSLTTDDDGDTVFAMTDSGRCPFLNTRGLCDIIQTLGEGALCQICDDHPRFRNIFSDRVETGIGLSCEAAAALVLTQEEPFALVTLSDDGDTAPTAAEAAFFDKRDALFAIATDRSRSIEERENALLLSIGADPAPLTADTLLSIYLPLERLDNTWGNTLASLKTPPSHPKPSALMREQLLCYFLFRHTAEALEDGLLSARVAFAVQSTRLLTLLSQRLGSDSDTFCELARQYSAEIEYSDQNPQRLFEAFS